MALKVHGISTCDTVRKACAWLDQAGVAYERIDLRRDPPARGRVASWVQQVGSKALRNTHGGSYRALPDDKDTWSEAKWVEAFAADPMLLKRPVIEHDGVAVAVGFRSGEALAQVLGRLGLHGT